MADENKIQALMESVNVADNLDEDKLKTIGRDAKKGFEADLESRKDWEKSMEGWINLAKQCVEVKTYPWKNASNVKYPLLSTASMQFAARAYPSLVPSDRAVVKATPIGQDFDGKKRDVAQAVSIYMSYQLLEEMDGWEEDMDRMLIMLPIVGVMFKKTYWDSVKKVNCSSLILPKNLVVDYWTRCLDDAERISEIIEISPRKVKERQMSGLWLDVDFGKPTAPDSVRHPDQPPLDEITPYEFIEQHTYLDLDDDDYPEPYIVTFQRTTGKVARIVPRYDHSTVLMDDEGKLQKIEPIQYYTKFGFVPSPDGSFYDIGFGVLLGPLNESVNTLINQLIDSGHLSSLQSGFLGKGLRLRMGEQQFRPGEWKVVNATGADLKQQILPLPTKEPSKTLFELMGSLITSGKELASVAEIFVGKMPGQNTPATTTMATIEQGMKVFTAVYKRIYRSLAEEFRKLYRLNAIYINPNTVVDVIDMPVDPDMFKVDQHNIYPGADPSAVSSQEKLAKAQGLMELLPTGVLDPVEVVSRILQAEEQPNWKELLNKQVAQTGELPPRPDPKMLEMQAKTQVMQQKAQIDAASAQQKAQLDSQSQQTQLAMKAQQHDMDLQHKQQDIVLQAQEAQHKQQIFSAQAQQDMNIKAMQGAQQIHQADQQHQQSLQQTQEQGKAKAQAIKRQAAAKPAPKKGK